MVSTELPSKGLQVRDVTVAFGGITALEDVSLVVERGEILGVIGPNGAGKTTLFNVICGFVKPDSGTLSWRGRALERHRPDRLAELGIARTLQGVGLFPRLTVLENVIVLLGGPLTTDPTPSSPITSYTGGQPNPPASGVPGS